MNKRIVLGMILVLLILLAADAVAFLLARASSAPTEQAPVVRPSPSSVHRSQEVPFSSHRAFSMVASQAATALTPWGMALDYPHGFLWVAEPGCEPKPKCPSTFPGVLGQYALSDGTFIQNFTEPAGYSSPLFVALDANEDVWFTQPQTDALGEFDPATQSWQQWPLQRGSCPFDLTFDRDGDLWFTEFGTNAIGFLNPRTHRVVEHALPTPQSQPYGITLAPQGTIWFTENAPGVGQIGSFTPTPSGAIQITEQAVDVARPHLITVDPKGNVWYSGGFEGDLGEFNPRSATSTRFVVYHGACLSPTACTGTHISGVAVDPRGNVWFSDSLSQRVGYLLPATGQVVARTIPASNAHPYDGLIVDKSQRVWFTDEFGLAITMWPASFVT